MWLSRVCLIYYTDLSNYITTRTADLISTDTNSNINSTLPVSPLIDKTPFAYLNYSKIINEKRPLFTGVNSTLQTGGSMTCR